MNFKTMCTLKWYMTTSKKVYSVTLPVLPQCAFGAVQLNLGDSEHWGLVNTGLLNLWDSATYSVAISC